jgi:hypothetical protein
MWQLLSNPRETLGQNNKDLNKRGGGQGGVQKRELRSPFDLYGVCIHIREAEYFTSLVGRYRKQGVS